MKRRNFLKSLLGGAAGAAAAAALPLKGNDEAFDRMGLNRYDPKAQHVESPTAWPMAGSTSATMFTTDVKLEKFSGK